MGTRLPKEKPETALTPDRLAVNSHPSEETDAAGTETLVKRLVRHVSHRLALDDAAPHADPEAHLGHDVILDMEVDGVRCLLVRLPPGPARAQTLLSPREQEIARMVAEGYPNKTIAAVLDISSWTVCTHLRRVFAKLGVGSRAAMVARLLEDGLLNQSFRPNALRKLS